VIYNLSKNKVLAEDVRVADSFLARLKGLMFDKDIPPLKSALVIKPCSSIHSFFMRFPIDVAFVGSDGRVLKILRSFKPWRIASPVIGSKMVIEMAEGAFGDGKISVGDVLDVRTEK